MTEPQESLCIQMYIIYDKKGLLNGRHPDSDRNRNARPCQGQGLHPSP